MDFQDAEARTVAERRREEERQRRREAMYKERVEAAAKDMEGKFSLTNPAQQATSTPITEMNPL